MTTEVEPRLTKNDLEQMLSTAIVDYQITNLTVAGDNMGSELLAVNVTIKTGKVIYLVAKMYPTDAVSIQVFNSPLSMRKEIDMYLLVVPEFQRIQEDHSVPPPERLDVFCRCVAARASRRPGYDDGSRIADENSVILMENLKVLGYTCADRIAGMNMDHVMMVVTQLAKFHATAIAIKMNKPLLFRNKIQKVLTTLKTRLDDREFEEKMMNAYLEDLERKSPVCAEHMEKLRKIFEEDMKYKFSNDIRPPLEPYATIVHNDLWTNNIMFKYRTLRSGESPPDSLKIIDFQFPSHGSPASDLLFFLFTSTQDGILSESLDDFLGLYHLHFVKWLRLLGCNVQKFSWDSFAREISIFSVLELPHILGMLNIVMVHKEDAEHMSKDPRENSIDARFDLKEDLVRRAEETVRIFVEKSWL